MVVTDKVDFNHVEESVVLNQIADKTKQVFMNRAECLFRTDEEECCEIQHN